MCVCLSCVCACLGKRVAGGVALPQDGRLVQIELLQTKLHVPVNLLAASTPPPPFVSQCRRVSQPLDEMITYDMLLLMHGISIVYAAKRYYYIPKEERSPLTTITTTYVCYMGAHTSLHAGTHPLTNTHSHAHIWMHTQETQDHLNSKQQNQQTHTPPLKLHKHTSNDLNDKI